jgi:hypothetical protein
MICCDTCLDWYHGKCVGITKKMGKEMEQAKNEWSCPKCNNLTDKVEADKLKVKMKERELTTATTTTATTTTTTTTAAAAAVVKKKVTKATTAKELAKELEKVIFLGGLLYTEINMRIIFVVTNISNDHINDVIFDKWRNLTVF